MTEKADEYEGAIDLMQADFEKQLTEERAHYESVIEYIDHHYEDIVMKMNPRFIKKHWVKSEKRGELMSVILFCLSLVLNEDIYICFNFRCTCRVATACR